MPTYCYLCECGEIAEKTLPASKHAYRPKCSKCGARMERDYHVEQCGKDYSHQNWPMECEASGVAPHQVREAAAALAKAGVPTDFNPHTGAAIYTSRSHRKKALQALGMYDKSAGYGDQAPVNIGRRPSPEDFMQQVFDRQE